MAIADDGDCDGTLTAEDCNDDDAASTIVAEDADCDGFLTEEDCDDDDADINPDAEDTLDDDIDNNCDGGDWKTCVGHYILDGSSESINIAELAYCGVVDGSIEISSVDTLTDTSGLSRLGSVSENFTLTNNNAMTSIDLPLLTDVGGELRIGYNDSLASVSMPMLEDASAITITNNPSLCQSVVDAIADGLSAMGWDLVGVPGAWWVLGNLDGC